MMPACVGVGIKLEFAKVYIVGVQAVGSGTTAGVLVIVYSNVTEIDWGCTAMQTHQPSYSPEQSLPNAGFQVRL